MEASAQGQVHWDGGVTTAFTQEEHLGRYLKDRRQVWGDLGAESFPSRIEITGATGLGCAAHVRETERRPAGPDSGEQAEGRQGPSGLAGRV